MFQYQPKLDAASRKTYAAFAAGRGIEPVLPAVQAILAGEPGSRVFLFYGNRDATQLTQLEELQALKDKHLGRLSLNFFFSREAQEIELFNGRLDADKLKQLAGTLFAPQAVDEYLLCGPGDMNQKLAAGLKALGVDPLRIHSEHFAAEPAEAGKPSAAPGPTAAPAADTVQITVLMDGRQRSFRMPKNAETILEAAESAGIELPFSCRAAVCSTCRTKVTKGEVRMQDNCALEDWEVEEGYILACQARPLTAEVELDYDDK